jgi:hypothetical protein
MATQFPRARNLRITWEMDDDLTRLARRRGVEVQSLLRGLIFDAVEADKQANPDYWKEDK